MQNCVKELKIGLRRIAWNSWIIQYSVCHLVLMVQEQELMLHVPDFHVCAPARMSARLPWSLSLFFAYLSACIVSKLSGFFPAWRHSSGSWWPYRTQYIHSSTLSSFSWSWCQYSLSLRSSCTANSCSKSSGPSVVLVWPCFSRKFSLMITQRMARTSG